MAKAWWVTAPRRATAHNPCTISMAVYIGVSSCVSASTRTSTSAAVLGIHIRERPVGIHNAAVDHRQQGSQAADVVQGHAHVVVSQHREIGLVAGLEPAPPVLLVREPGRALR